MSPLVREVETLAALDAARRNGDAAELVRIGGILEREGSFADAFAGLAEGSEIRSPPKFDLWRGPGHRSEALLIQRRMRHLGAELRSARFIECALRDVAKVIVATEARLIPLLHRSFPGATYIDREGKADLLQVDNETSYERLGCFYGSTCEEIERSFRPLVPPSTNVPANGIGIAWYSLNGRKQLPTLQDWADELRQMDGRVQSLQYDEFAAGLETLEALARHQIDSSPIDQRQDVDAFAGLVASVRGVLTISNTTAHMAGALGVPCVVLLDDLDHLSWPARGDKTPFYPNLRLIRQGGRPWPDVIQEGMTCLHQLIQRKS